MQSKISIHYFIKDLVFLLFILFNINGYTQSFSPSKTQKLDSLFSELEKNKMSMGTVSLFKNGKEVYTKTYGIANKKDKMEIPADGKTTLYRIGSISKIVTSYLTMKLVEEKIISLNQNISGYFPELKNSNIITIEDLLIHKSVLPVFHRVNDLDKLRKTKDEKQLITIVNKRDGNKDTLKTVYNNLNYILLGLIIEKANKKTYNQVLETNLSSIPETKIYGSGSVLDSKKNEANSFHLENERWMEDFENPEWIIPDGSGFLISNAKTLNIFMYSLFNNHLVSEQTLNKMLPDKTMFGYGLMKTNFNNHKGFGHTGRIEGFTSVTSYFPEDKINITLIQNGTVYPMNDILIMIGNVVFDEPFDIPNFKKIDLAKENQDQLLGTYVNKEEGYKVLVDMHGEKLRLRIAKGSSLMNKMILSVYALNTNRLFNPSQGIIFDFSKLENRKFSQCEMKVNGMKLKLERAIK